MSLQAVTRPPCGQRTGTRMRCLSLRYSMNQSPSKVRNSMSFSGRDPAAARSRDWGADAFFEPIVTSDQPSLAHEPVKTDKGLPDLGRCRIEDSQHFPSVPTSPALRPAAEPAAEERRGGAGTRGAGAPAPSDDERKWALVEELARDFKREPDEQRKTQLLNRISKLLAGGQPGPG